MGIGLKRNLRALARSVGPRLAGLVVLMAALLLRLVDPAPLEVLRLKTFDLYQLAFPRVPTEQRVVIVDIDEESLAAYGQWPWPRTRIAQLVDAITNAGAVAIAFDIMFPEPDRMSPKEYMATLSSIDAPVRDALLKLPSNDDVLAAAIARSHVVLGHTGYQRKVAQPRATSETQSMLATIGPDPTPFLLTYPGIIRNIPELEAAAAGRGVLTVEHDRDGVVRRVPLVVMAEDIVRPALSLELLRVATGGGAIIIRSNDLGIESAAVQGIPIPTDENGRVWIRFDRHNPDRFVSAKTVMENPQAAAAKLAGKLIVIGTSSAGLFDLKSTPLEPVVPGVEIHAMLLENVFDQLANKEMQLQRPSYALALELATTVVAAVLIIAFVPVLGAAVSLISGAILAAAFTAGAFWLYRQYGFVFDFLYPLMASFAVFLLLVFVNYLREENQRRQIRSAFGQYLSPQFVEELARNPDKLKLGGETKEMSILFSDVRNFTTISESFKSNPQGLTHLINRLLTPLSNIVVQGKGTIDKYMGDNIMAFWNAPLDDERHAKNACKAALGMVRALDDLNTSMAESEDAKNGTPLVLKVGVGINTGQCVVGNMGSDLRFDYTVLGDCVNLASRLEGQTKAYGVPIIVGARTNELVSDEFATLPIDLIRVKGKAEPEAIAALVGGRDVLEDPVFRRLVPLHSQMLIHYRSRAWDEAAETARAAKALAAPLGIEKLYDLYLQRIAGFRDNAPPDDWDGVYTAETK
jgi:adenylate cyclase